MSEKLNAPPRRAIREKLPIIASIINALLLATLAIGLGYHFRRAEANRAAAFEQTQVQLETVETHIDELKALITPLLAMDTAMRRLETQVMEVVAEERGYMLYEKSSVSPTTVAPSVTRFDRKRAARASTIPPKIALAARKALQRITPVSYADAIAAIQRDTSSRVVDEIILHHTATPIASYNGGLSVMRLAEFQVYHNWWSQVSWHYAVAPDGSIWLGAPLGTPAIHTPDRQKTTVSVLLIMNGDRELPSDAQREAVGAVLRALLARYHIAPEANFTAGHGLHRE